MVVHSYCLQRALDLLLCHVLLKVLGHGAIAKLKEKGEVAARKTVALAVLSQDRMHGLNSDDVEVWHVRDGTLAQALILYTVWAPAWRRLTLSSRFTLSASSSLRSSSKS